MERTNVIMWDVFLVNLTSLLIILLSVIVIDRFICLVSGDDKDDKDDKKKK